MKRLFLAMLAAACVAGSAGATTIAYDQTLANAVVTSTTAYTIDMSVSPIDLLSAQVTMSSVGVSAITFTDGRVSTGSFTITSTATLKGTAATDTLTVNTNSALTPAAGTDTITVSSNGVSALAGAVITLTAEGNTFTFSQGSQWTVGASSAATATSIAAAINNQRYWTATSLFGAVTITCANTGSACNSYTILTSTPAALATGSASFTGGQDTSYFTINSQVYIQGVDWLAAAQSSNTAVNIANAINLLDTQGVTASTTSSTAVTITAAAVGTAANSFTLASSTNAALTRGAASFSGGNAHASVSINGTTLTEGTDWTVSTATGTVVSLANSIGNNATLGVLVSTATTLYTSSGTVTITSLSAGSATNYRLRVSAPSGLTAFATQMAGGSDTAINLAADTLTLPAHGLTTGMGVRYTSGTVTIGALTNQTTYFALVLDANTIQVSTTLANALAGTHIDLTSTSTAGPHTFTLTPLAPTGSLTLTWQGSNDNSNWANLSVNTMVFVSTNAATASLWDFGAVNVKFIRAQIAVPASAWAAVNVKATGKRYGSGI